MKKTLTLAFALSVLWVMLSGHFEPSMLLLGALSVAVVVWLSLRMNVVDEESYPFGMMPALLAYWPWLLKEIVKSGLDVCRRVFGHAAAVRPVVFDAVAHQQSDLGLVIHANSITLTPGTVSLDTGGGVVRVHALHPDLAKSLHDADMNKRIPDREASE